MAASRGMLRFVFLIAALVAALAQTAPSATQVPALKIVVVQGENAVNIIQQKTAVAPLVEVRDRNNLPVPGAAVTFTIGGGQGATFGGATTVTVTTNAAGQAAAAGFSPTVAGAVQVNATAVFQGQTAIATITQTNVMTAAEAASAAGASSSGAGSAGGAGAGSGAGAGAGAVGGGLSGAVIGGIAGGVAAGGLAIGKVAGGGSEGGSANAPTGTPTAGTNTTTTTISPTPTTTSTTTTTTTVPPSTATYSGAFSGQFTAETPSIPCTHLLLLAGTITVTVTQASDQSVSGSSRNIFTYETKPIAGVACGTSGVLPTDSQSPVTGTTANIRWTLTGFFPFSGVLSGNLITGTITRLNGSAEGISGSIPVTLTKQ